MNRIYRALLRLFPSHFYDEFSREMAADFHDASEDALGERGWCGMLSVWLRFGADLARSVAVQWLRTGRPLFLLVSIIWSLLMFALVADQFVPLQRTLLPISPDTPGQLLVLILLMLAALPVLAVIVRSWFGARKRRHLRIL